jgi:hypothetical protein
MQAVQCKSGHKVPLISIRDQASTAVAAAAARAVPAGGKVPSPEVIAASAASNRTTLETFCKVRQAFLLNLKLLHANIM